MSGEHGAVCVTSLKLYLIEIKTIELLVHAVARKRKNVKEIGET